MPHGFGNTVRRFLVALTAAVIALAAAAVCASASTSQARLVAAAPVTPQLTIQTVCMRATGPDGKPVTIFGRRYSVGTPSADTPAIVLVHGVESNADTWDLTPNWSVARWFAYSGYVVIAYDELGFRYSPYSGSGNDITNDAQRQVLHGMIGDLHTGTYQVANQTGLTGDVCRKAGATSQSTYLTNKVAIIGHSQGGFIVSGYPGQYHDVAAMVQADSPSGEPSTNPTGDAALTSAPAGWDTSLDDKDGPIGDPSGDGAAQPTPSGYENPLGTRLACENFTLYRPTAVKAVATVMCNPANISPTPMGEPSSDYTTAIQNQADIPMTGSIPVLLADTAEDIIMPGNANQLEYNGWKQHCDCDVSQFILADTSHAFMAHTTLPQWMSNVDTWLRSKGVAPAWPKNVLPNTYPSTACSGVLVTITAPAGTMRTQLLGAGIKVSKSTRRFSYAIPYHSAQKLVLTVKTTNRRGKTAAAKHTIRLCSAFS